MYLAIVALLALLVLGTMWKRGHDLRTGERKPAGTAAAVATVDGQVR
jgi:hypothetical protein